MSHDPLLRSYIAAQERPPRVRDWSDLNDVLLDHAEHAVAALGSGWEIEGPLFEADELRVDIFRLVRNDPKAKKQVHLTVSMGFPTRRPLAPAPPERLPMSIVFQEGSESTQPDRWMKRLRDNVIAVLWMAGAMGSAGAAGYFTHRASQSTFLGFVVGLVTLVAAMFGPIVVMGLLGASLSRRRTRAEPTAPSGEFLAVVEKVQGILRGRGVLDWREEP